MGVRKIKVLLVVLKYANCVPLIPIGVLYIAHSLRAHQIDYKIIDLNFHSEPHKILQRIIIEYVPDYIGISIRNIAETKKLNYIYDEIKSIVTMGKKYAKVVLGGAGFSLFSQSIMEYTKADHGVVGPGEEEFVNYIQLCEEGQDDETIKIANSVDAFIVTDISVEMAYYWEDYGKYHRLLHTEIPIQRIRGCQFCCTYCSYPDLNSKKLQYRDIKLVIEEVDYLYQKLNYNYLYFVDATFNMDLAFNKKFLRSWYKKFQGQLSWRCCINPAFCDIELLQLMKVCGCTECEIGIDSCNDVVLAKMKKPFRRSDIIKMLNAMEQVGISYTASIILGGEGETEESVRETVACLAQFNPGTVTAFCGVRIYPETIYNSQMKIKQWQLFYASQKAFYISQDALPEIQRIIQNPPERWHMVNAEEISCLQ